MAVGAPSTKGKESNRPNSTATDSIVAGQSTRVNSHQQTNPKSKHSEFSSNGLLSGFADREIITPELFMLGDNQ